MNIPNNYIRKFYNKLTEPLPMEELRKLADDYYVTKSIETRNKIVMANMRMIFEVSKKYAGMVDKLDDLVTPAVLGLINGLNSYKPNIVKQPNSYLIWWIRSSIRRYILETSSPVKKLLTFKDFEIPETVKLEPSKHTYNFPEERIINKDLVDKACKSLKEKEMEVIRRYFGLGTGLNETLENIAKPRSTKQRIQQIKNDSLRKIRETVKRLQMEVV